MPRWSATSPPRWRRCAGRCRRAWRAMSGKPPLYARTLRLRHIRPGGLLCFAFFEGAVAVGILLALAELAPWWAALVLPAVVAGMVKVNDVVAGLSARARLVPA